MRMRRATRKYQDACKDSLKPGIIMHPIPDTFDKPSHMGKVPKRVIGIDGDLVFCIGTKLGVHGGKRSGVMTIRRAALYWLWEGKPQRHKNQAPIKAEVSKDQFLTQFHDLRQQVADLTLAVNHLHKQFGIAAIPVSRGGSAGNGHAVGAEVQAGVSA